MIPNLKLYAYIGAATLLLTAGGIVWAKWDAHQKYVAGIEASLETARTELGRTQQQLSQVAQQNRDNQAAAERERAARQTADRVAQAARADAARWQSRWREANDALMHVPEASRHGCDPVFGATVDRLYGLAPGTTCPN